MNQLIKQLDFFAKYNIDPKAFAKTTLVWKDLENIYLDYCNEVPKLESSAIYVFNSLMKTSNVHSVRYRIKEPEHLIEKIIRKRIYEQRKIISIENYKSEITDLIGLRALHLFKEQWLSIHELITTTWDLKEKPVANYRDGDSEGYRKKFEEAGCSLTEHPFGYRSIHYIIATRPAKKTYFAEIQVRTIFEEAWSEIDHTIRYPYDQDNQMFAQFLLILNRLAGSADEMGTFIRYLKHELQQKEYSHKKALVEKDNLIIQLEQKVKALKLKEVDTKFLTEGLEKLKIPALDLGALDLSWMSKFDLPQFPKFDTEIIKFPDLSWLDKVVIPKIENPNNNPPKLED